MKFAIICSLLASGLMFGQQMQNGDMRDDNMQQTAKPAKLSGYDRVALETSSPRVHLGRKNHEDKKGRQDRVVSDKNTINAFVPVGK